MAHEFSLRVYYEDTDAAGIVYYANYLKFIERARTEALSELGIDQVALKARDGVVFVVRAVTVDYRAPAQLMDRLVVTTRTARVGGARVDLVQEVLRDSVPLVRADVRIAALGPGGRPVRIPAALRSALGRLG